MSKNTALFISIENLINEKFEEILACVKTRRDKLLSELNEFRLNYKSKHESNLKTFTELEKMINKLEDVYVHQNHAAQIHESAVKQIVKERDALKDTIGATEFKLKLLCDTTHILEMIPSLGKLVEHDQSSTDELSLPLPPLPPRANSPRPRRATVIPEHYSIEKAYNTRSLSLETTLPLFIPVQRSTLPSFQCLNTDTGCKSKLPLRRRSYNDRSMPKYSAGNRGNGVGNIDSPLGLAYDPTKEKVYVVDNGLHKVVVFSSDGVFDSEFGGSILRKPYAIAIKDSYCCITDEQLNGVVKFQLSSIANLVKIGIFLKGGEPGEFNGPRGLEIDDKQCVYIADSINNRICLLNADLDFVRVFMDNIFQLPQDIKIINDMIYVLDRNTDFTVHSFTKFGNPIQSVISPGKDVFFPAFFCTDLAGQLFVTDAGANGAKVFSLDGDCYGTVGDHTLLWDAKANESTGVCVMKDGTVVCAFSEGNNALCFY